MTFKKPSNTAELRRYLGMVNFYHRLIESAGIILALLNWHLANKKKKDKQPINWITTEEEAFQNSKELLAKTTLLAHPIEDAKLIVKTDASNIAMGAVLEQYIRKLETIRILLEEIIWHTTKIQYLWQSFVNWITSYLNYVI